MKWMYDAITIDVQNRYLQAAGKNLPQVAIFNRRIPRSLKHKCTIFAWSTYAQLLYVLRKFCNGTGTLDLLLPDIESWGLMSVREMRDLVASMERPPQRILEDLTKRAVELELDDLRTELLRAQKTAQSLAFLQYASPRGAEELDSLTKIVQTLGAKAKFSE